MACFLALYLSLSNIHLSNKEAKVRSFVRFEQESTNLLSLSDQDLLLAHDVLLVQGECSLGVAHLR